VENSSAQLEVTSLAKRLAHRLLVIGENRIELLAVEVQEARERLLHAVLLAVAMAVLGLMAGMALSAAMVVLLWELSPVGTLFVLTALYAGGAALLYWHLAKLRRQWEALPGTLGQLKKDCECLQRSLN